MFIVFLSWALALRPKPTICVSVANSKNGYNEMNIHLVADEKIPVK